MEMKYLILIRIEFLPEFLARNISDDLIFYSIQVVHAVAYEFIVATIDGVASLVLAVNEEEVIIWVPPCEGSPDDNAKVLHFLNYPDSDSIHEQLDITVDHVEENFWLD